MLGAVLLRELQRASRNDRHRRWRGRYAVGLLTLFGVGLFNYAVYIIKQSPIPGALAARPPSALAHEIFVFLAGVQYVLPLLVLGVFAAGSLLEEKNRGTLAELLTTELSAADIVGGKLLAQVARVADLMLLGWPLLVLIAVLGGNDPATALLFGLGSLAPLPALAAAGMLAGVWCRRQSTAGPAAILIVAVQFVLLWQVGERVPGLGPLHLLELLSDHAGPAALLGGVLGAWLAWTAAALPCVGLAVWALRPAQARQLAAGPGPRQSFWKEHRPAVSERPLRWKERYCEGRFDLPVLRWLPRSALCAAVACLTAATSTSIVTSGKHGFPDPEMPAAFLFSVQSIIAALLVGLIVAVRSAASISGERERHTWDSLLTTALTPEEMVRDKFAGIVQAGRLYLGGYLVGAVPLAIMAGLRPFLWTVALGVLAFPAVRYLAANGVNASARFSDSLRSLLEALSAGFLSLHAWGALAGLATAVLVGLSEALLEPHAALPRSVDVWMWNLAAWLVMAWLGWLLHWRTGVVLEQAAKALQTPDVASQKAQARPVARFAGKRKA
jgi:ABC-type transport system involved in multi-copper enzyme maturation permease subunit